jgi:hypothetical protein
MAAAGRFTVPMKRRKAVALMAAALLAGAGGCPPAIAQDRGRVPHEVTVAQDPRTVVSAALRVLATLKIPVSFVDGASRVVRTASVPVTTARLRQLVPEAFVPLVDRQGGEGGRFVLEIAISPTEKDTSVVVTSMIVLRLSGTFSPLGGQLVPSNGALETDVLQGLTAVLAASQQR